MTGADTRLNSPDRRALAALIRGAFARDSTLA